MYDIFFALFFYLFREYFAQNHSYEDLNFDMNNVLF
jgi:hypothetical protein